MKKKSSKCIIFDFDGTIVDSYATVASVTSSYAKQCGYKTLSELPYEKLRSMTTKQVLAHIGISFYKLPWFARSIKKQLAQHIPHLQPFPHIKETIARLSKENFMLGIVTSNSVHNVACFLEGNQFPSFSFIASSSSLFNKKQTLKKIMRAHHLSPEQTVYIGDEPRDIEAARLNNIRCIAVSWGYSQKSFLEQANPDALVDKPEHLHEIIEKLIAST